MTSNNTPFSTEVPTEWKPDKSIKILTLLNDGSSIRLYENFYNKSTLCLYRGHIVLTNHFRTEGKWQHDDVILRVNRNMFCLGEFHSLSEIPTKDLDSYKYEGDAPAHPYKGYITWYRTELNEKHFIRLYISDYKLDNAGNLYSIEVQYQQIS